MKATKSAMSGDYDEIAGAKAIRTAIQRRELDRLRAALAVNVEREVVT